MSMKYYNKKNGTIAEFIEQNDVAKTVTLKKEDGGHTAVTISTFKRWWAKCDDNAQEPVENAEETTAAENAETTTAESKAVENVEETKKIEKSVADKKEEKKVAKKSTKSDNKPAAKEKAKKETTPGVDIQSFRDMAIGIAKKLNYEIKLYEKMPNAVVLKLGGKGRVELYFGKRQFRVSLKSDVLPEGTEYREIKNFYLDASINFEYTNFDKDLEKMLKLALKSAQVKEEKKKSPVSEKSETEKK